MHAYRILWNGEYGCVASYSESCKQVLDYTRVIQGNRPSLIDNIFTNAITKTVISRNLLDKLSDHMPNFAIFNELKIEKIQIDDVSETLVNLIKINTRMI